MSRFDIFQGFPCCHVINICKTNRIFTGKNNNNRSHVRTEMNGVRRVKLKMLQVKISDRFVELTFNVAKYSLEVTIFPPISNWFNRRKTIICRSSISFPWTFEIQGQKKSIDSFLISDEVISLIRN